MANSCRSGEGDYKRHLAIKARASDPGLSYANIAERVGVSVRSVERWLSKGSNLVQDGPPPELQPDDGEPDSLELDGLDDFLEVGSVTARPRNQVVRALCPESL